MSDVRDRDFNARLARIQIYTGILVALGATLVSVGVGFSLTVLPVLSDIIEQGKFSMEVIRILEEHTGIESEYAPSSSSFVVLGGLSQYSLIMVIAGLIFLALAGFSAETGLRRARTMP